MTEAETRAAKTARGAREETKAGGARWEPRAQPGRRPSAEPVVGGARVESEME